MKRSMKDVLIVFALCITLMITTVPVSGSDEARGDPWPPMPDFHNAYVYLNLTYENGTPADGFYVQYLAKGSFTSLGTGTNASGQVKFSVHGSEWGVGTIKFMEGSEWQGYEEFLIGPDESIYLDLVVGDVLADVNTISGVLRNKTSGEPVTGVGVKVLGLDAYYDSYSRSNTSDGLGYFEINVPNSSRPVRLEVKFSIGAEFFDYSEYIQILDPLMAIDHDIDLLPTYMEGSLFRLKAFNSTTDQVLQGGTVSLHGYSSAYDFSHRSLSKFPLVGDWYQRELSIGEYEFSWSAPKDPVWNVTLSAKGHFLMNDTPLDLEMGVAVPEF
ncbi:MAG: hypothetical protein KAH57_02790, partial [Thermoplasmata archaeon]|nr:hypothetical protein [Thermoplasmata archaeon]